jgi:hypothetical protein
MRDTLASLVMVLVSFPLIAPLLLVNAASGLPACCLRNGKHHCTLTVVDTSPSLRANQPKCPLFPKAEGVPAFSKTILFGAIPVASAPALAGAAIAHRGGPIFSVVLRDSVRKRGPPTYLN